MYTRIQRVGLLLIVLATAVPAAFAQMSVSTTLFYGSPYIWRGERLSSGFVLQPTVAASYGGFSLAFFGNVDPSGGHDGDTFRLNEADLTAAYGLTAGGLALSAGYTFYTFPTPVNEELEFLPTQEVFLNAGLPEAPLAPAIFLVYDFDERESNGLQGIYGEAKVGHALSIADQAIALGATLGFDSGYVLSEGMAASATEVLAEDETALSHLALTVGTGFSSGGVTISPMAGVQFSLADAYRYNYGKTIFYGGIGVGF